MAGLDAAYQSLSVEWPPGGAWSRVVERSVSTLPVFWLAPFANALDPWRVFAPKARGGAGAAGASVSKASTRGRGTGAGGTGAARAAGASSAGGVGTLVAQGGPSGGGAGALPAGGTISTTTSSFLAGSSHASSDPNDEPPPGGARTLEVGRSVITLPVSPLEKALQEVLMIRAAQRGVDTGGTGFFALLFAVAKRGSPRAHGIE